MIATEMIDSVPGVSPLPGKVRYKTNKINQSEVDHLTHVSNES